MKYDIDFYHKTQSTFSRGYNKNVISQLLSKYKHRNDIHEHGKQKSK